MTPPGGRALEGDLPRLLWGAQPGAHWRQARCTGGLERYVGCLKEGFLKEVTLGRELKGEKPRVSLRAGRTSFQEELQGPRPGQGRGLMSGTRGKPEDRSVPDTVCRRALRGIKGEPGRVQAWGDRDKNMTPLERESAAGRGGGVAMLAAPGSGRTRVWPGDYWLRHRRWARETGGLQEAGRGQRLSGGRTQGDVEGMAGGCVFPRQRWAHLQLRCDAPRQRSHRVVGRA